MGKTITLQRAELVWQYRSNRWDKEDFEKLLAWLKTFKDQPKDENGDFSSWRENHVREYDLLSQYTWDQIVDIIEHGNYEDEPKISYVGYDGSHEYTSNIEDVVKEFIREDNYDSDIDDEEYADDYDENFYFGEDPDIEA